MLEDLNNQVLTKVENGPKEHEKGFLFIEEIPLCDRESPKVAVYSNTAQYYVNQGCMCNPSA